MKQTAQSFFKNLNKNTSCIKSPDHFDSRYSATFSAQSTLLYLTCPDNDVSTDDGSDAVGHDALVHGPVNVLSEHLSLERREVD